MANPYITYKPSLCKCGGKPYPVTENPLTKKELTFFRCIKCKKQSEPKATLQTATFEWNKLNG